MCGIVGTASTSPLSDRNWLTSARDRLLHRGPDDGGLWWSEDSRVGLAHRRLSILDPRQRSNQPMHRVELGLSVVFNGEIYNFGELKKELENFGCRFQTGSDTEVLLISYSIWGVDCLSHLKGMFSFAIFDAPRKRIFLARDRAGEKPMFYYHNSGTISFASELKALMENPSMPRQLSAEALDCYLAFGFAPGAKCILEGVRKLPPAHALTFGVSDGRVELWRYWQPPRIVEPNDLSKDELLNKLEFLLESSVERQLTADVPVGVLLSGGIDSSLVTAMAARRSQRVQTFSVTFPGFPKQDEAIYSREIARHFCTDHHELEAGSTSVDILPIIARQFDEPIVDSSMIPTWLVSNLVSRFCKVALGGDGGDELFGGYHHYSRILWMRTVLAPFPRFLRAKAALLAESIMPIGSKGRNYLQAIDVDWGTESPFVAMHFDATSRKQLTKGYLQSRSNIPSNIFGAELQRQDVVERAMQIDFGNFLAEDILVKVDRCSMGNSLEVRSPFLDVDLIEFAFGQVPSSQKVSKSSRKIILRRLARRILPSSIDLTRKQGFSIPLAEWLKTGKFRALFWDTLLSSDCFFDTSTTRKLLEGQDRGLGNAERLFALVMFELWRRDYGISG